MSDWQEWRIPGGKFMGIRLFDNDGLSMPGADKYVFGYSSGLEFWAEGGRIKLVKWRSLKEIASRPMPDTMEEAVDWLRMVQAMHGGAQ